jgi:hypothetical protein
MLHAIEQLGHSPLDVSGIYTYLRDFAVAKLGIGLLFPISVFFLFLVGHFASGCAFSVAFSDEF